MRSSRVALSLLLALSAGVGIAIRAADARCEEAFDLNSAPPGVYAADQLDTTRTCETDSPEQIEPATVSDAALPEQPDHFDTGPEWAPEDATNQDSCWAEDSGAQDYYGYQHPQDDYGFCGEPANESEYHEQYYYECGVDHDTPEEGHDCQPADEAADGGQDRYSYDHQCDYDGCTWDDEDYAYEDESNDYADEDEASYDYQQCESDYGYGYESGYGSEHEYGYQSQHVDEEYDYGWDTDDEATAESQQDANELVDDDWSYDYDESGYEDDYSYDDGEESEFGYEDDSSDDYDQYYSDYDYTDEQYEEMEDLELEVEEADDAGARYDYDDFEYDEYEFVSPDRQYGYSDRIEEEMESETDPEPDATQYQGYSEAYPEEEFAYPEHVTEGTAEDGSEPEPYYDQFDYDYYNGKMTDTAEDEWREDSDYGYSYPEAEFDPEEEYELENRFHTEPDEVTDGYQEDDPSGQEYMDEVDWQGYDYHREDFEQQYTWEESLQQSYSDCVEDDKTAAAIPYSQDTSACGLGLFAWHPAELLVARDQQMLRTLQTVCREPSGIRRAAFNDYLEGLGWEAIDFAWRFEDVTGIEVAGLADNLPGAAAFLGSFRLVEQGEVGMDEAVDLLRQSLQNPSLHWIEGVDEITASVSEPWEGQPNAAAVNSAEPSEASWLEDAVVELIMSLTVRTLGRVGAAVCDVSRQVSDLRW